MTSGRPQGPNPHPAPRRPRPAGPEPLYPGAQGPLSPAGPALPPPPPGAAHSLLRHLLPHPASLRDYRVGRRGASGTCGCFRLPLRAEAGLSRPGRPSVPSSRWPKSGTISRVFSTPVPSEPCDDLAPELSDFFRSPGGKDVGETLLRSR